MKVNSTVKPATPWNVCLAKLTNLDQTIARSEGDALKARWLFGRELLRHRVDYKGRLGIPRDLMALLLKTGLAKSEINSRVQFASRYATKELMSDAIRHYPSWYQMTHDGLVDKKTARRPVANTPRFVFCRLEKECEKAYAQHAALTREDVAAIERLVNRLQTILSNVDQNDKAKAS